MPSYRLMVKTLNFHFKNVGSSPASLIMITRKSHSFTNQKQLKPRKVNNTRINSYSFSFVSLISPFSLKTSTLISNNLTRKSRKILVKQSYILVSWMSYLSNTSVFGSDTKPVTKPGVRPGFFVQPVRIFKTTTIKAPMAHKTFSQEQFLFKFFKLSISFKFPSSINHQTVTLNQSLHLLLSFRQNPFSPSTNLFFLKKSVLTLVVKDLSFFKRALGKQLN